MAQKSIAKVNPKLLRWAREQCGFNHEEAAKNYLNPEKLKKAEEGKDFLSFKQLILISKRYRRAPAFFYLKNPPKEYYSLIEDFRTIKSKKFKLSPILREKITLIREKKDLAVRLQKYDKNYNYSYLKSININANPENVANIILDLLKIDLIVRKKWKNEYEALKAWREAFERIGILVFQISRINVKEMRGFSISEIPYPIIALNRSDRPFGRIFTLIHELCHILLDKGGICTLSGKDEKHFEIEKFCNAVSGAVLVPCNLLKNNEKVKIRDESWEWNYDELNDFQKIFWASHEVILRRLLIVNKTTIKHYQKMRGIWEKIPKLSGGGPEKPFKKVLSTHPRSYIKIVLNAMYENDITLVDVSNYLEMKLKHLNNLEQFLEG